MWLTLLFIWSAIGTGASFLRLVHQDKSRLFTLAGLGAWGLFAAPFTYQYWWPFPLPYDGGPPDLDLARMFYGLVVLLLSAVWFLACGILTFFNLFIRDPE